MNSSKTKTLAVATLALGGIALGLTACNSSGAVDFLKTMSISVDQQAGAEYLTMTSTFDLGNVSLAEMTVDIVDPTTKAPEGNIQFTQLANGQSQIALSANTSLITDGSAALGAVMPNGNPVPAVLGATPGQMLGIPVLNNSTLYIGGNTNSTAWIGVALSITGFDEVMSSISTSLNLFFVYSATPNILGVGGIYGSQTPDESGVAIFGKYTAPTPAPAANAVAAKSLVAAAPANDYAIEKLNNYNLNKLAKYFYGKKRVLTVH
jgi:hypothetical protein